MKIVLDDGAYMPTRAHEWDAGLDLRTPKRVVLHQHDSVVIDTGVHVEIPEGYVGLLKSKSGLNVKHDIIGDGTIDAGYTGSIRVKLYNLGYMDYVFSKGDKIIQLVITPIILPKLDVAERLDETDRGDGGFGSSGK